MRFGLQKMTLLDYPGKVSCTVFTAGCNFRCPFCHNGSLVRDGGTDGDGLMDEEALLAFLRKRIGILEGVCITGGEPLLHRELSGFLMEVRAMDYPVKLDTNGSFPDRLKDLVESGLVNYVAMDIKNTPEKYARTIGTENPDFLGSVKASVDYLRSSDADFEFRTTVVKGFHTPEDFETIGEWIAGAPRYYLQKFVDSGDLLGGAGCGEPLPDEEMKQCLDAARRHVPSAELRGISL